MSRRSAALVVTVWALLGAVACGASAPGAPSATVRTVHVRVVALTYITNAPIAGAAVSLDGSAVAVTDASGVAIVPATAPVEHTVGVSAAGFVAIVPRASSTVAADGETWTFWLEPIF